MTMNELFSDRTKGTVPREHEVLPAATAEALFTLFRTRAQTNWFAQYFPEHCADGGNTISGTDQDALWANVRAVIPGIQPDSYLGGFPSTQSDDVLFDLTEYAMSRIAKPVEGRWHEYMKHFELEFAEARGRQEYRNDVNLLLQRGGTLYEMNARGEINRIGTPEVQQVVQQLVPASGDQALDNLLNQAKALYLSRRDADRKIALEKLWDAFERLKTVDVLGNKKISAETLLENITNTQFREVIRAEMGTLTTLGNQFTIRHHETDKHPVPDEAQDYLFTRMGALIVYLLGVSNRLN